MSWHRGKRSGRYLGFAARRGTDSSNDSRLGYGCRGLVFGDPRRGFDREELRISLRRRPTHHEGVMMDQTGGAQIERGGHSMYG